MNTLIDVKNTRDILKYKDEILAANTPIKAQIRAYNTTLDEKLEPTLDPKMIVDWDNLKSAWNTKIFDLFLMRLVQDGYYGTDDDDGKMPDEEEDKIAEIFFDRMERMQVEINHTRPREGENIVDVERHVQRRNKELAAGLRRNARRKTVSVFDFCHTSIC